MYRHATFAKRIYLKVVYPVPLSQMTLKSDPFNKVAIDIVGPLSPPTDLGHRCSLKTEPGNYNGNVFLDINLTSDVPVSRKPYDLPFSSRLIEKCEI